MAVKFKSIKILAGTHQRLKDFCRRTENLGLPADINRTADAMIKTGLKQAEVIFDGRLKEKEKEFADKLQ